MYSIIDFVYLTYCAPLLLYSIALQAALSTHKASGYQVTQIKNMYLCQYSSSIINCVIIFLNKNGITFSVEKEVVIIHGKYIPPAPVTFCQCSQIWENPVWWRLELAPVKWAGRSQLSAPSKVFLYFQSSYLIRPMNFRILQRFLSFG